MYEKKVVNSALKIVRGRESLLAVQWHVTERCSNKCKHCYIYDENYDDKKEMTTDECYKIIAKIKRASLYFGKAAMISFIGGDPLIREDINKLIEYSIESGIYVQIKTIPESLDKKTIDYLCGLGVKYFQLSLDGLETMHDYFRESGSYRRTLEAINRLKEYETVVTIKYTLSKKNSDDMLEVMDIVSGTRANAFTFTRYVPLGNGINENVECFSPKEYKDYLSRVFDKEKEISEKGKSNIQFIHRDHLWELLCYEKNVYNELLKTLYIDDTVNYGGCSGWLKSLVIDTDGECFTCRKYPSLKLGNIKDFEIMELFNFRDNSGFTNRNKYNECKECEVFTFCRSCPAVSQALLGDPYAKDPYCWR